MKKEVKKTLLDAAAIIQEQDHLARGQYLDRDSCYCVTGALMAARDKRPQWSTLWNSSDEILHLALSEVNALLRGRQPWVPLHDASQRIFEWNDHPDTTKEDAVELLQEAAAGITI